MTKVILTLVLLIISNTFMTLAWYGNLKLQDMKIISQNTSIVLIVLISWCIALRILVPYTGQPHWFRNKRWSILACAAEGYSGGHFVLGVRCNSFGSIQRRIAAMEPPCSRAVPDTGRLFCIYEVEQQCSRASQAQA